MEGKLGLVIETIRRKFDKTPVAVKVPCPKYKFYRDKGRVLLGYEVEVEYLYQGNQKMLFSTDEDKLGIVPRQRALANAISFYKETKAKIYNYRKSQKNNQK